ncbi:MAG: elongation factor G [Chloroflexi bacterium]|nr:elongation factor G [Chloroflexota bacterium]
MQTFAPQQLRNVALLSHNGAGKTSLAEALLFSTGGISRMGRVEDGNTVSDYEPEEIRRRSSIQLAVVPCVWNEHKITLLDTPGYLDFLGEALSALRVADAAVLVVSAVAGVEVGTERMWGYLRERSLPCILFINKMDRENADFARTLASIHGTLGKHCVPLQLPVGAAQDFKGILNLLPAPQEAPKELAAQVAQGHDHLAEAAAETDDSLATKYLEGEALTDEEILAALKRAVAQGKLVPVLAGAATQNIGSKELLQAITQFLPAPTERPLVEATIPSNGEKVVLKDGSGPLVALVFKTTADPYVGKLSYLRVYSGTLGSNSEILNPNKGQTERIGQLFIPRGKSQEPVPSLVAGDIGAVAKLSATATGDTLAQKDRPLLLGGVPMSAPVYTMAVFPKSKADLDKLGTALHRLCEEDPSLRFSRVAETSEMLLSGLGDTHIEMAVQRAQRKFGVNIVLQIPKVPYRETVTSTTSLEHRHRQQSGGHGHYAHIFLRLEPLPKGSGMEFAEEIVGGRVPKEFIPYVEKGVRRACAEGVLAGCPIVDVKAVLYDGSYHDVDSAGMDFDIAGYFALKKAMQQASPVLLEPITLLRVTVPDPTTGDIMGDLNSKRGRILGMTPQGDGTTLIEAHVPQAEVQKYALDLRSMTQGRGNFSVQFDHYEEVPAHLAQRILDQAKREKEEAKS